jgi:hypothetical protein
MSPLLKLNILQNELENPEIEITHLNGKMKCETGFCAGCPKQTLIHGKITIKERLASARVLDPKIKLKMRYVSCK